MTIRSSKMAAGRALAVLAAGVLVGCGAQGASQAGDDGTATPTSSSSASTSSPRTTTGSPDSTPTASGGSSTSASAGASAPQSSATPPGPSSPSWTAVPSPSTSSATSSTTSPSSTSTQEPTPTPSSSASEPAPTTEPTPEPTPTTEPTPEPTPEPTAEETTLRPGDSGPAVRDLQQRLASLGYWLGTPDSTYGHLTTQAVMALQGAAGLARDGIAGPQTRAALERGARPPVHGGPANRIEIDIARQVLLVVRGGSVQYVLHTSTGSGQRYISSQGTPAIATTPPGSYSVFRTVDGWDEAKLGTLYRPRYFNGGIAVHGLGSVPGYPASHGCARVSNPAMDLIWSQGLMPVGSAVIVH